MNTHVRNLGLVNGRRLSFSPSQIRKFNVFGLYLHFFEQINIDSFCIKDLEFSSDNLGRKLSKFCRNKFSEFFGVSFRPCV
jgi:hypothetical protein